MSSSARASLLAVTLSVGIFLQIEAQNLSDESIRPPASHSVAQSVTGLMGWEVGAPSTSFEGRTFMEAAKKTDAAGLGAIEAFSTQKALPGAGNLDQNLTPEQRDAVRERLAALKMRIVYHAAKLGSGDAPVLEFAKSLGAKLVIAPVNPADIPAVDKLASDAGVDVAIEARQNPGSAAAALAGASSHLGIAVKGSAVMDSKVMDRLMAIEVRPGESDLSRVLVEIAKHEPKPEEHPDACYDCGRPHGGTKPLFIALDTTTRSGVEQFETAVRPAMGLRVDLISQMLPTTPVDRVPAEDREKIAAAVPKQAQVKPKKARKLLVIDLSPAGGFYHHTVAFENLALQLMAKNTGAFEPEFNNDLNNLKYPAIKKYDAVFLNSIVGEVFADPAVLNGLLRFVREGGGVAGVHGSTYASMDIPEYSELMGAADGPHKVEQATLKIDDPDSPLTRQFHGQDFTRSDEFYHFLPTGPFSRDKLHVLISIDASKTDLRPWKVRPDNDYGSVWIKSYGKGRVFNCAMGHTASFYETPDLEQLMLNAIQFVLGDLPADTTPSARLSAHK